MRTCERDSWIWLLYGRVYSTNIKSGLVDNLNEKNLRIRNQIAKDQFPWWSERYNIMTRKKPFRASLKYMLVENATYFWGGIIEGAKYD